METLLSLDIWKYHLLTLQLMTNHKLWDRLSPLCEEVVERLISKTVVKHMLRRAELHHMQGFYCIMRDIMIIVLQTVPSGNCWWAERSVHRHSSKLRGLQPPAPRRPPEPKYYHSTPDTETHMRTTMSKIVPALRPGLDKSIWIHRIWQMPLWKYSQIIQVVSVRQHFLLLKGLRTKLIYLCLNYNYLQTETDRDHLINHLFSHLQLVCNQYDRFSLQLLLDAFFKNVFPHMGVDSR